MTATEISNRLHELIVTLGQLYPKLYQLQRVAKAAEAECERSQAVTFLKLKAEHDVSIEEIKRMTQADMECHGNRLASIAMEAEYKAAWGEIQVAEKEFDMLRSLLGMERVKVDKGIEMGDHAKGATL